MHKLLSVLLIFVSFYSTYSDEFLHPSQNFGYIIPNNGQWKNETKYICKVKNSDIIINQNEIKIFQNRNKQFRTYNKLPIFIKNTADSINENYIKIKYVNSNVNSDFKIKKEYKTCFNYFNLKNNSSKAIKVYPIKELVQKQVYNGIDIRYYFDNEYLRNDFIVQPGYDPNQIILEINNAQSVEIENGSLKLSNKFGDYYYGKIYAYQPINNKEIEINCNFQKISDTKFKFEIKNYNKNIPLIIDPILYSFYFGGSDNDGQNYYDGLELDSESNLVIFGYTESLDFPDTGKLSDGNRTLLDPASIFFKISNDGERLIYSSVVYPSTLHNLTISKDNKVYLLGSGFKKDLKYDTNIFGDSINPNNKACNFLIEINDKGDEIIKSTNLFIQGNALFGSYFHFVLTDKNNDLILVAMTNDSTLFTTENAIKKEYTDSTTKSYSRDLYFLILDSSLTNVKFASYFGGSYGEQLFDFKLFEDGKIIFCGITNSNDFPVTENAISKIKNTYLHEGFFTILNYKNPGLYFSTYQGIAKDNIADFNSIEYSNSFIFIAGKSHSSKIYDSEINLNFDFDHSHPKLSETNFISIIDRAKFKYLGYGIISSEFTDPLNKTMDLAVDSSGNLYFTTLVNGDQYPVTDNAIQKHPNLDNDYVITKFDPNLTKILYSTYLAGNDYDDAPSIAIDKNNNLIFCGYTESNDLPVVNQNINYDGKVPDFYIAKFDLTTDVKLAKYPTFFLLSSPNPVKNDLYLNFNSKNHSKANLKIFNIDGILQKDDDIILESGSNQIPIDVSNLVNGTYFILLNTGNETHSGKFVVNR